MKITISVPHFSLAIGRNESGLGMGLSRLGHEATILTTSPAMGGHAGALDSREVAELPYRVAILPRLPLTARNPMPFGVRESISEIAPDVMHSSEDTDLLTVHCFAAAKSFDLPFVLSTERYYVPKVPWNVPYLAIERLWTQRIRREADVVTTHSNIQQRYWRERGLERPDVEMIPVGVWTDQFSPGASTFLRDEFKLASDAIVAFTIGRMTDYKDYPTMLRGLRRVVDVNPSFHLVVAGFGPRRKAVVRLAGKLGLGRNVHFSGVPLSHALMPEVMRSADFYLQTSAVEPFGIAVVEAMATGKPVVVTDVGGMADTVIHGSVGLKARAGDPQGVAECVLRMADADFRDKLGRAARQRAVEVFDWLVVCRQYVRAYERAAARRVEVRRERAIPVGSRHAEPRAS